MRIAIVHVAIIYYICDMPRFTVNIEINKRGTTSKTRPQRFQVSIRIYDSLTRKKKRIPTGVWLSSVDSWNTRKQEIKSHAENGHADEWNEIIMNKLQEVREYCKTLESGKQTLSDSKYNSDEPKDTSFLMFVRNLKDSFIDSGQINYGKRFNTLVLKLEKYIKAKGKIDISYSDVDYEFCLRFESFLKRLHKQNNRDELLSQSAVAEILTMLKTSVRKAVSMRKIKPEDNPFLQFSYSHGVSKKKEKLNYDEIRRLEALEFEDSTHGKLLLLTRDTFLFSFYAAGMRFEDVCMLRWSNIQVEDNTVRVNYTMHKNGKTCDWLLVPDSLTILKRWYDDKRSKQTDYVFPLLDVNAEYAKADSYDKITVMSPVLKKKLFRAISSRNVVINRSLKELMNMADIYKSISFHCARHSVANLAVTEGIGLDRVRGILKHTNYATTQQYVADFNNSANDQTLREIFYSEKSRDGETVAFLLRQIAQLSENERILLISEIRRVYQL